MSTDDEARAASAAGEEGSWKAGGLEAHRPEADRVERDRVLAAVQSRLLGKKAVTRIGRFEITERVGAGAMGAVYRGRDTELGRHVALKLLHQAVDGSAGRASRIVREAKALAKVHHPNVVTVFDIGTHEDRTFVAMELVDGATLTEWLAERKRPWREVVAVMTAAGKGLEAVHREGLVHRDLKPDNILIDARGVPRIADFGLVKPASDENGNLGYDPDDPSHDVALTATGALMGTPAYMAPEQLQRGEADAQSDQYAFGATFYEALYGERPFAASTIGELVELTAAGAPPPAPPGAKVPKSVHAAVRRALQPHPAARYPDMTALLADLEKATASEGMGLVGRLATIALALVVLGGGYWVTRRDRVASPMAPVVATEALHEAAVTIVPADAQVSVDGQRALVTDGRLTLSGPAGASFVVRVAAAGRAVDETVVITRSGLPAPARVVLELAGTPDATSAAPPAPPAALPRAGVPRNGEPQPPPSPPAPSAKPSVSGITPVERW